MSNTTLGVIVVISAVAALIFLRRLLFRFVSYVLSQNSGRVMFGALLLIGGLIFGFTSHVTPYQSLPSQTVSLLIAHVNVPDDGDVYLEDISHPGVFYIIHEADFSPSVTASAFQNRSDFTSLIYDSSTSQQVSVQYSNGFGSVPIDGNTGYTVEQFILNGSTFSSAVYQEHPEGAYQNNWLVGGGIAGAGALLLLLGFGLPLLLNRWERPSAVRTFSGTQPQNTSLPGQAQPGVPMPPTGYFAPFSDESGT